MSEKAHFELLFGYHWRTTERLLGLASGLDTAVFHADPGLGRRSMADLAFHLFVTDRGWRVGLESGQQPAFPDRAAYPDLPALQAAFAAEEVAWNRYFAGLEETAVSESMPMTALNGATWPLARWRVLQHVILHGMQHHTELAQLLSERGASPGDIDFLYYRG